MLNHQLRAILIASHPLSGIKRKEIQYFGRETKIICMGLTQSHSNGGAIPIPPARGCSSSKKKSTYLVGSPVTNVKRHLREGFHSVEFQNIEQASYSGRNSAISIEEALKEVNQGKNRYSNVLPIDATRVKLKVSDDIHEHSDYINANYVQGEDTCFIATQGPLSSTANDFWRMVWETKSSCIVMLTKDKEGSRIKCDKYWPDNSTDNNIFGNFKVELVSTQKEFDDSLIQRVYKILNLKEKDSESRTITHIQFLGWPDHGVPDTPDVILEMLKKVDLLRDQNSKTAPIVIHCSAGIGRTGAFIAAHIQLTKLRKHIAKHSKQSSPRKMEPYKFDVYETVLSLRRQRLGMVQQNEQYRFIYEILLREVERIGYKPSLSPPSE